MALRSRTSVGVAVGGQATGLGRVGAGRLQGCGLHHGGGLHGVWLADDQQVGENTRAHVDGGLEVEQKLDVARIVRAPTAQPGCRSHRFACESLAAADRLQRSGAVVWGVAVREVVDVAVPSRTDIAVKAGGHLS